MKHLIEISWFLASFIAVTSAPNAVWARQELCKPYSRLSTLSSKITYTGSCYLSTPQTLARKCQYYPAMDAYLQVDYWQGEYSRPAHQENVVRIDVFDCWGNLLRSFTRNETSDAPISFAVDNPNLHCGVRSSYEANAPMTDTEAGAALIQALGSCENAGKLMDDRE